MPFLKRISAVWQREPEPFEVIALSHEHQGNPGTANLKHMREAIRMFNESPRGTRIAFEITPEKAEEIRSMELDENTAQRISSGEIDPKKPAIIELALHAKHSKHEIIGVDDRVLRDVSTALETVGDWRPQEYNKAFTLHEAVTLSIRTGVMLYNARHSNAQKGVFGTGHSIEMKFAHPKSVKLGKMPAEKLLIDIKRRRIRIIEPWKKKVLRYLVENPEEAAKTRDRINAMAHGIRDYVYAPPGMNRAIKLARYLSLDKLEKTIYEPYEHLFKPKPKDRD